MQALPVTSPSAPAPRREEGPDPQDGRFGAVMASYLPFQTPPTPDLPKAPAATRAAESPEASARSTSIRPAEPGARSAQGPEKVEPASPEPPAARPVESQAPDRPAAASQPTPQIAAPQAAPEGTPVVAATPLPKSALPPPPDQAPNQASPGPKAPVEAVSLKAALPVPATATPTGATSAEATPTAAAPPFALPPGIAADHLQVQITSVEPTAAGVAGSTGPQPPSAAPVPTPLLPSAEDTATKAPLPKVATSEPAPTTPAPMTTAPLRGATPETETASTGGDSAQARPGSEGARRMPAPEPPQLTEAPLAAASDKAFTPAFPAPKVDAPRPEPPRSEGPKLQPLTAPGHDGTLPLSGLTPATAVSAEVKTAPSPVVNQVEGTLRWMVKGAVPEARLQLHPESLGKVAIELKITEGQVHAKVWVQDPAAMQALQDGRASLEQALKQSGLQLGSFDLQQGGEASRQSPEPEARNARGSHGEPTRPTARQEAPAVGGSRSANSRRIELYA